MTLDHHVLRLKSLLCLPNDVVNQKIIKNHLDCTLLSAPSVWLPLLVRNSAIYVSSSNLIALDNSGTFSQMGTLPEPAVHTLCLDSSWDCAWMHTGQWYEQTAPFETTAYFFLTANNATKSYRWHFYSNLPFAGCLPSIISFDAHESFVTQILLLSC